MQPKRVPRIPIWILPVLYLSGCGLTDAHIDLGYYPEPTEKSPLSTVNPMRVSLHVDDQRPPTERNWVGNKRNGFGMVTAWIKSNKDPTRVVHEALKNEFILSGHKVTESAEDPSDLIVEIGLKRYWGDARMHFWEIEAIATIDTQIDIREMNKSPMLSRTLQSTFRESRQIMTDGAYESVLNGALREFIRNFSRDPSILKALREGRGQDDKPRDGG